MASWKQVLSHYAVDVEGYFDNLKSRLAERLGVSDPIMIQAYRGFGSNERLYLRGRVLENEGITPPEDNDSLWENLLNMYRRFESDEVPHAILRARFQGREQVIAADEEGFFEAWIRPSEPLPEGQLWHTVELELLEPLRPGDPPVRAEGQVFVPPTNAQFGVISDIDDTVLLTEAAHLLRMARNVFMGNARTRLPFKGVAAFYRALFKGARVSDQATGAQGWAYNPLFYVSSSPWNLYDLLSEFFHLQDIPFGPVLLLRDWGISENEVLAFGHHSYKLASIQKILSVYPRLPFILIGDSGQEDPEIYADVVAQHPDRILAIYIRNVSHDLERPEAIRSLARRVADAGSTLILADDTLPMAEHAASMGWIMPETLPVIQEQKEADERPPTPVEKLLGEEEEKPEAPTVVIDAEKPGVAKAEVEAGAIEGALEESKAEGEKPPTVVVDADQAVKEKEEESKEDKSGKARASH